MTGRVELATALSGLGYSRDSFLDLSTVSGLDKTGQTNARTAFNNALQSLSTAGGGTAFVPAGARYRFWGGDPIIPPNVTLSGAMYPGAYRPGANWQDAPSALVCEGDAAPLQRRNSFVRNCSIVRSSVYDIGAINTVKKACDAVSSYGGTGLRLGDGSTGDSAGNATDAGAYDNLIVGFGTCIETNGSSRLRVMGNYFDGHNGLRHIDVFDPGRIFDNHGPIMVGAGYANRLFDVTNAANNGSGAIRLTLAQAATSGTISASDMTTNQYVVVNDVGGVPNASGVWQITVINPTTVDLIGSTWAGTYTSGGQLLPPIKWRRGCGIYLKNTDGSIVTGNFANNYTVGLTSIGNSSTTIFGNFFEGYGHAHAGNIGLLLDEDTVDGTPGSARSMHTANSFSVFTQKVVVRKGSLLGFSGMATGSGTSSIIVNDGETTFDGCIVEGSVAVGDNITRLNMTGGIMKGSFTGSAAALRKVAFVGGRQAGVVAASGQEFDVYIRRASDGAEVLAMTLTEGRMKLSGLPTSASGLTSGDVWNDAGTLKIVP